MTSFAPFVVAPGVSRAGPDLTITLPSPPRSPGDPVVRPGAARHEGASLVLLPLAAATDVALRAPVTGTVRRVVLGTEVPGVTTLLEVSPLPFGIRRVLRRLPAYPTFYLAAAGSAPVPVDHEVVRAGGTLTTTSAAWVGMVLGDRVTLSPAAWVELVGEAMAGEDTAPDVATWQALATLAGSGAGRTLRVLDHVGRPAPAYQLTVDGTPRTTGADGTVPLPAGEVAVRWTDATGPVHARYETSDDRGSSTPPGEAIRIPAGGDVPHLQLLDADRWFGARPAGLDDRLGHLHLDSRVEPLVDGVDTFRVLLEDLRAATGTGCGAHFAGWSFNDFPFDLADEDGTMFEELVRTLRAGTTQDAEGARFLMDRYLVFRDDAPPDDLRRAVIVLLLAGAELATVLSIGGAVDTSPVGYAALGAVTTLGVLVAHLASGDLLLGALEEKVDGSLDFHEVMEGIRPGVALRARHPARWLDNPLRQPSPIPLVDHLEFLDGVGSWHQKFQVVRREPDALGNRVVGYLGGVDVNQNRLDTPGHHGSAWKAPDDVSNTPSPRAFHDVHARVTGPAAADVARTFERRWEFDAGRQPASTPAHDPAFVAPAADDIDEVPPQPARHLVQVARSGFAPTPSGTELPWSTDGEEIIPRALIQAIDEAREYIYIEDQYFTPTDPYIHALLEASTRTPPLRLVIVMPTASDQLFGDVRRREMFERLRHDPATGRGWGDRLVVGAPVRRPVLADGGRIASRGRLFLASPLSATGDDVVLAPRSRVAPDVPFWLWVEGERMLAVEQREDLLVDDVPARRYLVSRPTGAEPLWGSTPRAHDQLAPVTLAQEHGIYVHTKVTIVDDVFVAIGSCNTNRRGLYHDGEITAFAVPEQLKAAPENPALALRTALWAEHLGMPPAMGPALLADPVAAVDLFRRPTVIGNRLSSFAALGITPELGFPGESAWWVKALAGLGIVVADELVPYAWNTLIEPTSATDPDPVAGPELGAV